jgi:hypothetical protein
MSRIRRIGTSILRMQRLKGLKDRRNYSIIIFSVESQYCRYGFSVGFQEREA